MRFLHLDSFQITLEEYTKLDILQQNLLNSGNRELNKNK